MGKANVRRSGGWWEGMDAFERGLGAVAAIAFLSTLYQVEGLFGPEGLEPAAVVMRAVERNVGGEEGWDWFLKFPTLLWFAEPLGLPVDVAMEMLCAIGVVLGIVAVAFPSGPLFTALWILYLSVYRVGGTFLSFQWDILLLEALVLAALCASWGVSGRLRAGGIAVRFLLFKLMLMSGLTKLQAGCPTWENLSALRYHFATQCLPTPLAWWFHQLPPVFLEAGTAFSLLVEGPVAFFLLFPGAIGNVGAWLSNALMVLIMLSGNYTFFNILTILLTFPTTTTLLPASFRSFSNSFVAYAIAFLALAVATARMFSLSIPTTDSLSSIYTTARLSLRPTTTAFPQHILHLTLLPTILLTLLFTLSTILSQAYSLCKTGEDGGEEVEQVEKEGGEGGEGEEGEVNEEWGVREVKEKRGGLFGLVKGVGVGVRGVLLLGVMVLSAALFRTVDPQLASEFQQVPLLHSVEEVTQPFAITAPYGLFRRMTGVGKSSGALDEAGREEVVVARPEVVIEVTHTEEGNKHWFPINFPHKPTNISNPPTWIAPLQPRLDWQMWFAALSNYQHNQWLIRFMDQILEGAPQPFSLLSPTTYPIQVAPSQSPITKAVFESEAVAHAHGLRTIPFPALNLTLVAPKRIRASLYHYDFTHLPSPWFKDPTRTLHPVAIGKAFNPYLLQFLNSTSLITKFGPPPQHSQAPPILPTYVSSYQASYIPAIERGRDDVAQVLAQRGLRRTSVEEREKEAAQRKECAYPPYETYTKPICKFARTLRGLFVPQDE